MAERVNRLIATVWKRGWDEKPRLDPDYLWKVGAKGYAREDELSIRSEEEVADFRNRLERLCASLTQEAQLNALGHTMAYGQLRNAIRKRHALGRLWRKKPELAQIPIASPIIVLGQMRSGTTRVQRLLAADPGHAGTRFCDSHDPVPATPDLRPLKARAALFMARRLNPWLDALHPFGPTRTDEEIGWLSSALSPAAFEAQWHIPAYVRFSEGLDAAPVYAEFARILRTDAATRGNADLPRVLKCPQFAEDPHALFAHFPDAQIVHCRRSPSSVLESSVSLVASQIAFQSERHDLAALEREWARKIALREGRMEAALAQPGAAVAEIDFAALGEDWEAVVEQAYATLDLDFTPMARKAMAREQARSQRGTHRQHRAMMDEFGKEAA